MESHAERTILVAAHVVGFAAACADRGNLATFDAVQRYYALTASVADAIGGRFIKGLGDGVLLTFPPARAAETVSALRSFQIDASGLWQQFDRRCRVQVRIGAGDVQCGVLGPAGHQRFDVIGSDLNRFLKAPWTDFEVSSSVRALLAEGRP